MLKKKCVCFFAKVGSVGLSEFICTFFLLFCKKWVSLVMFFVAVCIAFFVLLVREVLLMFSY